MLRTLRLDRTTVARQLLPRDVYFWVKAIILALIAIQLARLTWAVATPVGAFGPWVPAAPETLPRATQVALLSTYDPFAGAQPSATVPATADLSGYKLFGTRMGMGGMPASAIVAGPDGVQGSFSIGDQLAPGLRLASVAFDYVTLSAGGQESKLAMEDPTPTLGGQAGGAPAASPAATGAAPTAEAIRRDLAFAPRMIGGRVTGLLVSPVGGGATLQSAGLRSGDVVVAVNGRRISGVADAASLQSQLTPGARLSLSVERGASVVPVALVLAGSQ